jgi:2-desacetyl-2-hydroxyethyl bacteriochlorophyllide A dehydrogenase
VPYELKLSGPQQVELVPYEDDPVQPDQVRARAVLSGISHGTELNLYRGSSPFGDKQFDRELRLFLPQAEVPAPIALGYEWVGRVTETGSRVTHLQPGDLVHLMLPHRETHTVEAFHVPYMGRLEALPSLVTSEQAIFIALAGVALQAVHDARIKVGDRVAVFGLGVIGLFVVQLARLNGAAWIDAMDPIAGRRELALGFGADRVLDPAACDVGYEIKSASSHRGADVAIEVSGHYPALHEAIRCVRQAGRVVAAGFYQGGGTALHLGEEWHHNRVTMVSSMAVWQNPHRDYPLWDRARIDRVVVDLLASRLLRVDGLITQRFPFTQVAGAYELIDRHPGDVVKVVLTYD